MKLCYYLSGLLLAIFFTSCGSQTLSQDQPNPDASQAPNTCIVYSDCNEGYVCENNQCVEQQVVLPEPDATEDDQVLDSDKDEIEDDLDNCPLVINEYQDDLDEDDIGDLCDTDIDGDEIPNDIDNCKFNSNPNQVDSDGDLIGDVCDDDDDGDDILDSVDNCPSIANADQKDLDSDGQGDECDSDDDGDGVQDSNDNCPYTWPSSADQFDNDNDGFGDECDSDDDNDGALDENDNCLVIYNPSQSDNDNDSIGTSCDPSEKIATLVLENGNQNDFFGGKVSISNNYALVGSNIGKAYLYVNLENNTWFKLKEYNSPDIQSESYFGKSVHINGNYAIIGAASEDNENPVVQDAGAAYIIYKGEGGEWENIVRVTASDLSKEAAFGSSVFINENYAIVGAPNKWYMDDATYAWAGAVYIFQRIGINNWVQAAKLLPSDIHGWNYFGQSVSLNNDYAIVGAADGSTGAVYVFKKNNSIDWKQVEKLKASAGIEKDGFGSNISTNNNFIVVGAWEGTRTVYIYRDLEIKGWSETKKIINLVGTTLSLSQNNRLISAANNETIIYQYDANIDDWIYKLTITNGESNCYSNSLSVDSNISLIGASCADDTRGVVYIYSNIID